MNKMYMISLILLSACAPAQPPVYKSPIVSIGGCGSDGMCGVRLADGTILADVRQPVIGSVPDCTRADTCHEIAQ